MPVSPSEGHNSKNIAQNFVKFHVVVSRGSDIDVPKGQIRNRYGDLDTGIVPPLGCNTPQVDVIRLINSVVTFLGRIAVILAILLFITFNIVYL